MIVKHFQSMALSFLGLAGCVAFSSGQALADSPSSPAVRPKPAIFVTTNVVVPVTKVNYAMAETVDIVKDYVQK